VGSFWGLGCSNLKRKNKEKEKKKRIIKFLDDVNWDESKISKSFKKRNKNEKQ
jgi:hypothetical protein